MFKKMYRYHAKKDYLVLKNKLLKKNKKKILNNFVILNFLIINHKNFEDFLLYNYNQNNFLLKFN